MSYQLFMELMAMLKKRLQDLWIEREQFAAQLLSLGYTQEQLH